MFFVFYLFFSSSFVCLPFSVIIFLFLVPYILVSTCSVTRSHFTGSCTLCRFEILSVTLKITQIENVWAEGAVENI